MSALDCQLIYGVDDLQKVSVEALVYLFLKEYVSPQ